jgi:hypothetical protein
LLLPDLDRVHPYQLLLYHDNGHVQIQITSSRLRQSPLALPVLHRYHPPHHPDSTSESGHLTGVSSPPSDLHSDTPRTSVFGPRSAQLHTRHSPLSGAILPCRHSDYLPAPLSSTLDTHHFLARHCLVATAMPTTPRPHSPSFAPCPSSPPQRLRPPLRLPCLACCARCASHRRCR